MERGAIEYRNYRTAMRIADAKRMIQSFSGFAFMADDPEEEAWYLRQVEIERSILAYLTTIKEN
jgi:hypothetical protein